MPTQTEIASRARAIYEHFEQRPGSEYIATEYAIQGLMQWVVRSRPGTVLEIGAGIGTLTRALLDSLRDVHGTLPGSFRLVSIEDSEYCLEQLRDNLGDDLEAIDLIADMDGCPPDVGTFDFVIIDGGAPSEKYFTNLSEGGLVFLENWRFDQRKILELVLRGRAFVRSHFRPNRACKDGGYWVFLTKPSLSDTIRFRYNNLLNYAVDRAVQVARNLDR